MATKALVEKTKGKQKYDVRLRNRCQRCGRPRAFLRKFSLLPGDGAQGRDPGRAQGELVKASHQLPAISHQQPLKAEG